MTRDHLPRRRTRSVTVVVAALTLGSAAPAWNSATAATVPGPRGHDVSSHQGKVNWKKAKADGAKFVYVKATEGTNYKNPHFSQQFHGARKVGILHGAYHFARPDSSSGKKQAGYFVANGGRWKQDGWTLPPAVDLEAGTTRYCHGVGTARMRAWISSFSGEVLRRTGRHPVIYTSGRWWKKCTGNSSGFAANHPLWLADWGQKPGPLPGGWQFRTIWQYANKGPLPGDQNRFNGSAQQLRDYARG